VGLTRLRWWKKDAETLLNFETLQSCRIEEFEIARTEMGSVEMTIQPLSFSGPFKSNNIHSVFVGYQWRAVTIRVRQIRIGRRFAARSPSST
jgi:hypothetical protein